MRACTIAILCLLVQPPWASADVTSVTITSRSVVADGYAFGKTGSYETLVGRIEFAIDPNDRHNTRIADVAFAPRDTDGRVRFSSDLMVLQPTDRARGNGILLFEIANRGNKAVLPFFNRAAGSASPSSLADFGDGLLSGRTCGPSLGFRNARSGVRSTVGSTLKTPRLSLSAGSLEGVRRISNE